MEIYLLVKCYYLKLLKSKGWGGGAGERIPRKRKDLVSFTNLTKIAYHFEIFCGYTSYF